MEVVPGVIPPATPVVRPIVPIPEELLLHVPPGVVLDNGVVYPAHIINVPVIGAVAGLTVTVLVALFVQPKPLVTVAVYVNTVDVETVVGCTYTVVVDAPVYGVVKAASINRLVEGDHVAAADEVIVRLPPLHIALTEGVSTGAAGTGFTVTTAVDVVVHVPFVAANV